MQKSFLNRISPLNISEPNIRLNSLWLPKIDHRHSHNTSNSKKCFEKPYKPQSTNYNGTTPSAIGVISREINGKAQYIY
jgi:hypothetical protein